MHVSCHVACDFGRNDNGALHLSPKQHVETMCNCYCNMIGTKSKLTFSSSLEKGKHPELDTSEKLDSDDVQQCQSMVSTTQ